MTYDQLMQHAKQITEKAVNKEGMEQAQQNAEMTGGEGPAPPVDFDKIRSKYSYINELFEPFSQLPDPAKYDPLISDIQAAMGDLSSGVRTSDPVNNKSYTANPKLDRISTAGGYLQNWTGDAAEKFKSNFLDTFQSISSNQFVLLATMQGALAAHQEMWRRARKDIDDIAHKTMSALDNAGGCGKNQWSFGFSVLGAVAAIGGVTLTALTGGVGAIAIAAIGAAGSTGSAVQAGITASGDSAETITDSMKDAVNKLAKHIEDIEHNISSAVDNIDNTVSSHNALFVAARPKLADLKGTELTSDEGMGQAH